MIQPPTSASLLRNGKNQRRLRLSSWRCWTRVVRQEDLKLNRLQFNDEITDWVWGKVQTVETENKQQESNKLNPSPFNITESTYFDVRGRGKWFSIVNGRCSSSLNPFETDWRTWKRRIEWWYLGENLKLRLQKVKEQINYHLSHFSQQHSGRGSSTLSCKRLFPKLLKFKK